MPLAKSRHFTLNYIINLDLELKRLSQSVGFSPPLKLAKIFISPRRRLNNTIKLFAKEAIVSFDQQTRHK